MRLCFIVEELYRHDSMPLDVAHQLRRWGHTVDLLEPPETLTCLSDLPSQSSNGIYRAKSPADLATLEIAEPDGGFLLAQHYAENPGYDIKLYVIGNDVYAVARKSPLHPKIVVHEQRIPLAPEWRRLALRAGRLFGLDIYGLDVVETRNGPAVVDINDFPSFGHVPGAVSH